MELSPPKRPSYLVFCRHVVNDEAVDACYGKRSFKSELERLEFLFELYRRYTEPLGLGDGKKKTRRGR